MAYPSEATARVRWPCLIALFAAVLMTLGLPEGAGGQRPQVLVEAEILSPTFSGSLTELGELQAVTDGMAARLADEVAGFFRFVDWVRRSDNAQAGVGVLTVRLEELPTAFGTGNIVLRYAVQGPRSSGTLPFQAEEPLYAAGHPTVPTFDPAALLSDVKRAVHHHFEKPTLRSSILKGLLVDLPLAEGVEPRFDGVRLALSLDSLRAHEESRLKVEFAAHPLDVAVPAGPESARTGWFTVAPGPTDADGMFCPVEDFNFDLGVPRPPDYLLQLLNPPRLVGSPVVYMYEYEPPLDPLVSPDGLTGPDFGSPIS